MLSTLEGCTMLGWNRFRTALAVNIALFLTLGAFAAEPQSDIPADILALFQRLDALDVPSVKVAKYVRLDLFGSFGPSRPGEEHSVDAWLIAEDTNTVSVLTHDLRPQTYNKHFITVLPSSWRPSVVALRSVHDADFEAKLKELITPDEYNVNGVPRRAHFRDGPATRCLMAYAAWQKGLTSYCVPIIQGDWLYQDGGAEMYAAGVWEDLAWRHFKRGVNLLMFADRELVVQHLKLSLELSPEADFGEDRVKLIEQLETIIARHGNLGETAPISAKVDASKQGELFLSQLTDLRCEQDAQPGFIMPYVGPPPYRSYQTTGFDENMPTAKLQKLGMEAVPALIAALEDDTPTRTVYHWRDFAHSRLVWRISDFAWHILRDITKKDLGYRPDVGFTFGEMKAEEKKAVIDAVKEWYAQSGSLSDDDRMLAMFDAPSTDEWIQAGVYFLQKNDKRAVEPLLKNIPQAGPFERGKLCRLVAYFGDPAAKDVIKSVMTTASEPSDRIGAAIALYQLGDASGIPVAIDFVKMKEQPYGNWEEPVWLLMHSKTPEALEALKNVLLTATPEQASDLLTSIASLIPGSSWSEPPLSPAGNIELCPMLIAAMDRAAPVDEKDPQNNLRVKDQAAMVFALMKGHAKELMPGFVDGRFLEIDPAVFDQEESDSAKRDTQIEALKTWYEENKDNLVWNSDAHKLDVKSAPQI